MVDGINLIPGKVYVQSTHSTDPCSSTECFQVISNKNGLVNLYFLNDRSILKVYLTHQISAFYELTEEEAQIVKAEYL